MDPGNLRLTPWLRGRGDELRLQLLELHDLDELRAHPGAWLVEALGVGAADRARVAVDLSAPTGKIPSAG